MLAGIDYSMGNPAITIFDEKFYFYSVVKTKKVQGLYSSDDYTLSIEPSFEKSNYDCDISRYDAISDWAINILKKHTVDKVQLEGYSYGSSVGLAFNIAELTSLLKYKMYKNNIEVEITAPTELKKWFTGYGNATKEMMVDKFIEKTNFKFQEKIGDDNQYRKPFDDIVDSYVLWSKRYEE